jgi:hypothetical protein
MSATHASRASVAASPNSAMPRITVPTAPMPVHTAYAVPTGSVRIAHPSSTTLTIIAAAVPTLGHRRVKPSVVLSPIAQATSKTPATTSTIHAMA